MIGVLGFDPPIWEAHGAHCVEGRVPTQGGVVRSHGLEPQSTGEVTGWSWGRYGPPLLPQRSVSHVSIRSVSCCNVSPLPLSLHNCVAAKSTSLATTEHRATSVGAKRVRVGKCNSHSVLGGVWVQKVATFLHRTFGCVAVR